MNGTLRSNSVQNTKVISYIKLATSVFQNVRSIYFLPTFSFLCAILQSRPACCKNGKNKKSALWVN